MIKTTEKKRGRIRAARMLWAVLLCVLCASTVLAAEDYTAIFFRGPEDLNHFTYWADDTTVSYAGGLTVKSRTQNGAPNSYLQFDAEGSDDFRFQSSQVAYTYLVSGSDTTGGGFSRKALDPYVLVTMDDKSFYELHFQKEFYDTTQKTYSPYIRYKNSEGSKSQSLYTDDKFPLNTWDGDIRIYMEKGKIKFADENLVRAQFDAGDAKIDTLKFHLANGLARAHDNGVDVYDAYISGKLNYFKYKTSTPKDTTPPTPPTLAKSPDTLWCKSAAVTLAHGTDSESGVARSEYSFDNVNWQTYAAPIAVNSTQTIYARTVDNQGNISAVSSTLVRVDSSAPTAPSLAKSPNTAWSNGNVTVTITPGTDGESGIARSEYSFDGVSWQTYGGVITVSSTQTVYARMVDNAGNLSTAAATSVQIDTTKPAAPAVAKSPDTEWATGNVTVTLTGGGDGQSGLKQLEYSFDNAAWNRYTGALSVSDTQTVYGRAVDNAGNASTANTVQVKIDKTAPAAPSVTKSPDTAWADGPVSVTLAGGSDGQSGLNRLEYSLDNQNWQAYSRPLSVAENRTVYARSVDNAGNVSVVQSVSVKVDTAAPTSPAIAKSPDAAWADRSVTVTLTPGTDGGSGIKSTEYSTDRKTWKAYAAPFPISSSCTVFTRSTDNAGNVSGVTSAEILVDTTPPTAPVIRKSPDGDWSTTDIVVSIQPGTDYDSGIQSTEYSFDGKEWEDYAEPLILSEAMTVYARTTDNTGHVSPVAQAEIKVDKTAPEIADVETVEKDGEITVTVTATDEGGSGVKEIRVNGQAFEGEKTAYTVTDTDKYIRIQVFDRAGNRSEQIDHDISVPYIRYVEVDESCTSVEIQANDTGGAGLKGIWVGETLYRDNPLIYPLEPGTEWLDIHAEDNDGNQSEVKRYDVCPPTMEDYELSEDFESVSITAADKGGSGVKGIYVDGELHKGNPVVYKIPVGTKEITAWAEDNAGNIGKAGAVVITVDNPDKTAPTLESIQPNEDYTKATLTASDSESGIHGIFINNLYYPGNPVEYPIPENVTRLEAWAQDKAGNLSEHVRRDVMPPIILSTEVAEDFSEVLIFAYDEGGSGLKEIRVNGEAYSENPLHYSLGEDTRRFTIGESGGAGYTIGYSGSGELLTIRAQDGDGNQSRAVELDVTNPDTEAPKIERVLFNDSFTEMTVIASDTGGSGVKGTYIDGKFFGGNPVVSEVPNAGSVVLMAVDKAGNRSEAVEQPIPSFDRIAPRIEAFTVDSAAKTARITASDEGGSGVEGIAVNGILYAGEEITFEIPVGCKTLTVYAQDKAGNRSETATKDVSQVNPIPDGSGNGNGSSSGDGSGNGNGSSSGDGSGNGSSSGDDWDDYEPGCAIRIITPERTTGKKATVKFRVTDYSDTGMDIVEARTADGQWEDITDNLTLRIYENTTVYARARNNEGQTAAAHKYMDCFENPDDGDKGGSTGDDSGSKPGNGGGDSSRKPGGSNGGGSGGTGGSSGTGGSGDTNGSNAGSSNDANSVYLNNGEGTDDTISGAVRCACTGVCTCPASREKNPMPVDGGGTVIDYGANANREFFTIDTDGGTYYVVVDKDKTDKNVFLLSDVMQGDLTGLAKEDETPPVIETPEPEETPQPVPEPEPKKSGNILGTILVLLLVALAASGAYYYFKIYKPKQDLDDADDIEDFDFEEPEQAADIRDENINIDED